MKPQFRCSSAKSKYGSTYTTRPRSRSTKAIYFLFSSLTLLTAAAGGRVAAESCRVKRANVHEAPAFEVGEGPMLVDKVEVRIGLHEASAFKVDEGDLFLVANGPHGGRKRPRGC